MVELRDAAIRHELVRTVLRAATEPLSAETIYQMPKIKERCKGAYNVRDSLIVLHRNKEIRKVPVFGQRSKVGYELGEPNDASLTLTSRKSATKPVKVTRPYKTRVKPESLPPIEAIATNASCLQIMPMLEVLLTKVEITGFLKGALVMFPDQREGILSYLASMQAKPVATLSTVSESTSSAAH